MNTNEQAKERFLDAASKLASGDYEGSVTALNEAIEYDANFDLAYLTRGSAYMKMAKPTEAVFDFSKALELKPDSPRCHHLRGLAYHQKGDTSHAVKDFDKAIGLDPEYGVAYLSRANLHEQLGNDEAAQFDREMVDGLGKINMGRFSEETNIWDIKTGA